MAGRKRKPGRRIAGGRLANKPRPVRAKEITDVATNQPHRAWLPEDRRKDQRAESALGRLFLAGLITEPECWAGERFRSILREFHVVLASPVTISTVALMVAEGVQVPMEADHLAAERPETDEERRERVLAQFSAAERVLDCVGSPKKATGDLDALLMRDVVPDDLEAARGGLKALAGFWRMVEPPEDPQQREVRVRGRRFGDVPDWPHEEKEVEIVYK